jgi:hypothetical protein
MVPSPITNGINGTHVSANTPSTPSAAAAPRDEDYTVILAGIVDSLNLLGGFVAYTRIIFLPQSSLYPYREGDYHVLAQRPNTPVVVEYE